MKAEISMQQVLGADYPVNKVVQANLEREWADKVVDHNDHSNWQCFYVINIILRDKIIYKCI